MEPITLPHCEVVVSRVALGGCPLGGHGWGEVDTEQAVAAVRRAYELGINFFDTADVYGLGRSEELLSQALGHRKLDVIIASKFGVRRTADGQTVRDISTRHLREALEASLRRLQVDCIPLYYIHWPDGKTPVEEAVAELERCRASGKIRAIGVSNFDSQQLRQACTAGRISAAQVQYSLVDRVKAEALRETAKEFHIPLITWGSLAQGLLTGKYDADSSFATNDRRSVYANFHGKKLANNLQIVRQLFILSRRLERTPGQVAIRWLLQTSSVGCVLFGAKNPRQVEDNFGAVGWQLSAKDYDLLQSLNAERPADAA
jgi:myo-inositol catabolism protein IolS